jgi:hypothetical protein
MPASAAQISANRQNCLKSTGPKTPEGKDISRRNGLKHGLSGSGPLILEEDANEIDRRTAALSAELDPKSAIGAILVVQLATLSVKMERGAKRETAALGVRVRHATEAFDEARLAWRATPSRPSACSRSRPKGSTSWSPPGPACATA